MSLSVLLEVGERASDASLTNAFQPAKEASSDVSHLLVNDEGIPVEDIMILTPAAEKRSQWKKRRSARQLHHHLAA
jgi:hypothetical protein